MMKHRIVIIAGLLALMFIAPAYAAEKTLYTEPSALSDDNGMVIYIDDVKVSDTSEGYSLFNYPPTDYQFYTVYYRVSNPTDSQIRYQLNLTFVDDKGQLYQTEEFNLAEYYNAGTVSQEQKEFAIYRNATGLRMQWQHIDHYLNLVNVTNISLVTELSPSPASTATPTPGPTSSSTPTSIATSSATLVPSPSPSPTSAASPVSPLLTIGAVSAGFVVTVSSRMPRRR